MNDKRFTIKSQDDYWAVVDNYNDDKVCVINGIHTEIEAVWLCDLLNEQQATIEEYEDFCLNLCKFLIGKGLVDEYREEYGKEYKIITKWKGCGSDE